MHDWVYGQRTKAGALACVFSCSSSLAETINFGSSDEAHTVIEKTSSGKTILFNIYPFRRYFNPRSDSGQKPPLAAAFQPLHYELNAFTVLRGAACKDQAKLEIGPKIKI